MDELATKIASIEVAANEALPKFEGKKPHKYFW